MISENPLTWATLDLNPQTNKNVAATMLQFQKSLAQWANQIQRTLTSPAQLSAQLSGSGALLSTALSKSTTQPGPITVNQTINTASAAIVFFGASWTAAANATMTFNNVADGAIVFIRLLNNSGAARTFIFAANSPTPTALTVLYYGSAGQVTVSSPGTTVNNGATLVVFGIANLAGSNITAIGFNA